MVWLLVSHGFYVEKLMATAMMVQYADHGIAMPACCLEHKPGGMQDMTLGVILKNCTHSIDTEASNDANLGLAEASNLFERGKAGEHKR